MEPETITHTIWQRQKKRNRLEATDSGKEEQGSRRGQGCTTGCLACRNTNNAAKQRLQST